MSLPRIAICGVHIESSTFTPYISTADDFEVTRGDSLLARYDWLDSQWGATLNGSPCCMHAHYPAALLKPPPTRDGRRKSSADWRRQLPLMHFSLTSTVR